MSFVIIWSLRFVYLSRKISNPGLKELVVYLIDYWKRCSNILKNQAFILQSFSINGDLTLENIFFCSDQTFRLRQCVTLSPDRPKCSAIGDEFIYLGEILSVWKVKNATKSWRFIGPTSCIYFYWIKPCWLGIFLVWFSQFGPSWTSGVRRFSKLDRSK